MPAHEKGPGNNKEQFFMLNVVIQECTDELDSQGMCARFLMNIYILAGVRIS